MRPNRAVDLDFASVRAEYELPSAFPDEVEREAANAQDRFAADRIDAREIPFVTIDPPGSLDLDQAVHLERTTDGFRLSYAIADVGAFIEPGGALDTEARLRGQTIYLPDGSVPLHPRILGEQLASLVAGEDRPAVLWQIDADASGRLRRARLRRALVHVTARLDYAGVQDAVDRDVALPPAIEALPSFGAVRAHRALERGAIELQLPAQELTAVEGGWRLRLEPRTQVDAWNSECSLATGIAAAAIMVRGGAGLLRTLPRPDAESLARFRDAARAFGIEPGDAAPGALLASLPPQELSTLALNMAATKLLRGSGYLAFDTRAGDALPSADRRSHAGVANEYAHVTAPIRRLADRFGTELCLELSDGEWFDFDEQDAQEAAGDAAAPVAKESASPLADIPAIMQRTGQLANAVDNACLNLAEATALADQVGSEFAAGMLRPGDGKHDAEVFVFDPPVIAQCRGDVPPGRRIQVRLIEADIAKRRVRFELAE
ncbi:RNB domain-containing ribonuclease [Gulosibacter macacae]|uniref:RNB domain-containing ribonuclease n=1 Tax=Gulosibacter macacae TaxID=2488791 RepID=A0A3P3VZN1_9MICO|nr:RNB domain-containing ribonuclease [Gulosibacter macacae]RRJ88180.1 RNB domain-containing ribonuclease [Gulosibacter macacae]